MSFFQIEWPRHPSVSVRITTRDGGVSLSPYASFNLASHVGDDLGAVEQNRKRFYQELGHEVSWFSQVHGVDVVALSGSSLCEEAGGVREADGVYTNQVGNVCAVLTADCLPVLLASDDGTQVAAVHCGWRGLAAGILAQALDRFVGPLSHVSAFLGPAISQAHFEVGEDVKEAFLLATQKRRFAGDVASCFEPQAPSKYLADLYAIARYELQGLGVEAVYGGGLCTYSDERFYSYRKEGRTGRMASAIWITPH